MVKCGQVLTDGLAGDEFPELFPALRRDVISSHPCHVQLVRGEGRDVPTLYWNWGGGGAVASLPFPRRMPLTCERAPRRRQVQEAFEVAARVWPRPWCRR